MTQLEKFERARDHLSGALMQVIDNDDQIIVGHIQSAYDLLRDALSKGSEITTPPSRIDAAAEPTREEIALTGDMIENMLDRIVEAAVYYEQAEGIYNGPAKQELQEAKNAVRAILALKPRGGQTREETIEECAKVCERFAGANAASEPYISYAQGRTEGGQALAAHIRALSKPRGEPAREGGK